MRSDSTRSTRQSSPRTATEKRPLRSTPRDRDAHDPFTRFVGISTSMLGAALAGGATVDDLLERTLTLVKDVAGSSVELVCVRNRDEIRSRASVTAPPTGLDVVFGDGAMLAVAAKGLHAVPFTAAEELLGAALARHDGVHSWHCLPLANEEHVVGLVYMGMPHTRDFTDDDRELLDAFGSRATTAFLFFRQREALERTIRARDQMLSVVAHDLRNPLNVIGIAANTLLQRFSDSTARPPIERIIRSAYRADRMIRDLLEIDAIESGRLSLERQQVEAADLLLAALDSQQALAAEASVILSTDLSPQLPRIEGDEEKLHRVLENLIGNAIKFTGAGGHIIVGASPRGDDLLVWVKDSGIGIAPEHLPHVFDRFYQAGKADRHGTGLGLTICRGIVEAHGGRIWVESTRGEGTTMYFTLPSVPEAVKSATPPRANILLVDDRPENLVALEAILSRPDYRLVTAASGDEALSIALREHFAVALIDVAMPGMNGLDVAVNLKALERSRDIPIIFITAFGNDPEEIHRAYTAGGADYLVKPLDAEIVRKKVAVFVELSRRRTGNGRAGALV
jgi:signal transduction histidine kinase/CheY-like chemotaxis protein